MELIEDAHISTRLSLPGTLKALSPRAKEDISIGELGPILIAAPHPDDETLGCGGLIARCARLASPVTVLAMTNGEASHPGDSTWRKRLAGIRRKEQRNALKTLGLKYPDLIPLELPDGGLDHLAPQEWARLQELIGGVIASRGIRTLFVPAADDCHPDHRLTAKLLANVALSYPVDHFFSYQIWPPRVRPPHLPANESEYTHDISDLMAVKRRAVYQHRSQLGPFDPAHAEGFRMPQTLLQAKLGNTESFALVRDIGGWSG